MHGQGIQTVRGTCHRGSTSPHSGPSDDSPSIEWVLGPCNYQLPRVGPQAEYGKGPTPYLKGPPGSRRTTVVTDVPPVLRSSLGPPAPWCPSVLVEYRSATTTISPSTPWCPSTLVEYRSTATLISPSTSSRTPLGGVTGGGKASGNPLPGRGCPSYPTSPSQSFLGYTNDVL